MDDGGARFIEVIIALLLVIQLFRLAEAAVNLMKAGRDWV
jgi:hypothetical protein